MFRVSLPATFLSYDIFLLQGAAWIAIIPIDRACPTNESVMTRAKTYGPTIFLYFLLSILLVSSSGMIVRKYPHDIYYLVDLLWRSELSQVPHVDFQSPIGQSLFLIYSLVNNLVDPSVFSLVYANILVAGVVTVVGLVTLRHRLPPVLLFFAVGIAMSVSLSPRSIDFGILQYDWLGPYNRWGWSISVVLALVLTLPRTSHLRRPQQYIDAAAIGISLAFLFYLKMSFFLAMAVLAIATALMRTAKASVMAIAVALLITCIALIETSIGNTSEYLQDLGRAAAANRHEGYVINIVEAVYAVFVGGVFWAACILIFVIASPRSSLRDWLSEWWRGIVLVSLVVGAGVAIGLQNHPTWEASMHCAALILAAELVRRARATTAVDRDNGGVTKQEQGWRRAVPAGIAISASAALLILDSASVAAHAAESRLAAHCKSGVLRGTSMENVIFPAENLLKTRQSAQRCSDVLWRAFAAEPPRVATAVDRRLLRTVQVLRTHVQPGEVILALEFSNPYPFIFEAPPPKGALIWLDRGRSYSTKVHPNPQDLLANVDVVVQTDYPSEVSTASRIGAELRAQLMSVADLDGTGFGQDAWAVYGPFVQRQFAPVARTGEVTIWRRRL